MPDPADDPSALPAVARPRLRVGVLFGGRSGEHEVSLQSARAVMDSLRRAGHGVVPIGIRKDGRWLTGGDPLEALLTGEPRGERAVTVLPEPGSGALLAVGAAVSPADVPASVDVIFPVLHGTFGEDGTVQGLLDLAGIPYVGSGVLGSSVGMNKVFQKAYWRGLGLPIVDWVPLTRREVEADMDAVLERVEQALGYPCFTKPANLGSSVGVAKAKDRASLRAGLLDAARYDAELLVERGHDVREMEVGVLGNDEPLVSVVGEIIPNAEFYSYRAKYIDDASREQIPADIPPETADEIRTLAARAFRSVHASGLARVDFFLERSTGHVFLNEVNTMPGFTRISMYPKLWEASGVPFPDLVDRLVHLAVARHQERSRNQTEFDTGAA